MKADQTAFRAALLDPQAERPPGLSDGAGHAAGRRFDVYRNNVAVSLTEALETAFPVVRKLVGEANFKILAGAFLRQHPPSSPLMMYYGVELPDFLSLFGPTRDIGYLPDVARLELAIRESYHAADSAPVDTERLRSLDADALMRVRLRLAPSLRLVRSQWPVLAIWRFNTAPGAPKPQMAAEDVAVLRPDLDPIPRLLPPGGGRFLEILMSGAAFGEAIEGVGEADFDLTAVLTLLVGDGAISHIGD